MEPLRDSILRHARYSLAQPWQTLSPRQMFDCVALAIRDVLVDRWLETERLYHESGARHVNYLSIEYLPGRLLASNLYNLNLRDACRDALRQLGADLDAIEASEPDPALGHGGLGRLAACMLDSLATLGLPARAYGINYEYGLFRQRIDNGYQKEMPDNWLASGTPWQIERPEASCLVPIYGRIEHGVDRAGGYNPMWLDWRLLVGVPHDVPIVGCGGRTVNTLRLFSARSSHDFDIEVFNEGDYLRAVEQKLASETVSKVLYPSITTPHGQELRLVQEYFLVACTIRDIVRRYERTHARLDGLPRAVAIHLNDTHPSLAIAELMRVLVDEHDLPWDVAWDMTRATFAYTNHTLAPESLEEWPAALLERVVPRHLQIIYEINRRFMDQVRAAWPGDEIRAGRMSIVDEQAPKQIRMAHLSIVGSHSVNGVSAVHSDLLRKTIARDFHELWPERFSNRTNGVTPRRWLALANPPLARLISGAIGDRWVTDLEALRGLERYAADAGFRAEFMRIKRANKEQLAAIVSDALGVLVDPAALCDMQVKRIHEYKRQLLHVLAVMHEYLALVEDGREPPAPRTHVFAGKAMPGYVAAKRLIKLICSVAATVNGDRRARNLLRVVFVPDYRVSLAERLVPAADLSEQISRAGTEASGTSNMKLAMNGALTMATRDGANLEILEAVGDDNMFIFGLTVGQADALRRPGAYQPRDIYRADARVKRILDAVDADRFCANEPGLFRWIGDTLLEPGDAYLHLADLPAYLDAQGRAGALFAQAEAWAQKAILTVARMGRFSSDRMAREYARDIWEIAPVAAPEAVPV